MPTKPSHLLSDHHLALLGPVFAQVLAKTTPAWSDVRAPLEKLLQQGLDALTDAEADVIASHPHALAIVAQIIRPEENDTLEWTVDERHMRLVAADQHIEAIPLYSSNAFNLWCIAQYPDSNMALITLEATEAFPKKGCVYIEVQDDNQRTLLEGELINGEITVEIENLKQFTGPFTIRFRIIG